MCVARIFQMSSGRRRDNIYALYLPHAALCDNAQWCSSAMW